MTSYVGDMTDVVFVVVAVASFALLVAFARGLDRL